MNESTITDLAVRDDFDDKVPRVRDIDVGESLGMAQPRDIRRTIEKYADDLKDFGELRVWRAHRARETRSRGGHKGGVNEYWLNKDQAVFVAGRSDTELGRKTYKLLVKAFGVFERMVFERIPPLLRAEFAPWSKTWQDDLMKELCALKGEIFTGKHPRWGARPNSVIYECLLGKEVYAQLKAQNPKPSRGHNHHQMITPEYRDAFEKQLGIVTALAATSTSLADLESRLRWLYQKKPLQLPLWAARRMPSLAKALPKPRARKLERPA